MALSSSVGSFTVLASATAGTTIPVTGLGFQPKAIKLWWSGRTDTSDAIGRASARQGFGFAVSATDRRCIGSTHIDAQPSSDISRGYSDVAAIITISVAGAIDGAVDVQSMDSDGFTLIVDDQLTADLRVSYLALGGNSITNALTGQFSEPGATGNQDTTGLGFQPDYVMFSAIVTNTAAPTAATSDTWMIGATAGATQNGVLANVAIDGQATMDSAGYCTDAECIAFLTNTSVVASRAVGGGFLADGFRLNWTERSSNRVIFYLALKGGNYRVDSLLTQTDTTTDIVESGFGFQPSGAMFLSAGKAEDASDTPSVHYQTSIGAFSGLTNRVGQAVQDEDGTADSEITTAIEYDAVYANIATDSSLAGLMDVKSIDSGGFTLIMDDADLSQAFVWYVAFGPALVVTTRTATHTLDAVLKKTQSATHLIDTVLRKTQTATHSLDTALLKTQQATHTLDSALLKTQTAAHALDARLLQTRTATHLLNLTLLKTQTATHSLDSTLLKTQTLTHVLSVTLSVEAISLIQTIQLLGQLEKRASLKGELDKNISLQGSV